MRFSTLICTLALGGFSAGIQASAIDFWHSNTVWVNFGMCSASFTFDEGSSGRTIENMQVELTAINSKNKPVSKIVLDVDDFGRSNAERYSGAFWEDENACDDTLKLRVTAATARIDGQKKNLLAEGLLNARDFKPFQIQFNSLNSPTKK